MKTDSSRLKQRALSEWLLLRWRQGEAEALESLLTLWHPRFLLYVRRRLGNSEAAKDVLQEGLINIIRSLGRLEDAAAFPGWSYRILERRCADWHRASARESELINSSEVPEGCQEDNTETRLTAEELLARLDTQLASTIRLHYLEGFSIGEIAAIYEVPAGTIKSRLFYGRKLLRQVLEDDRPEPTTGDPK
jgi:RNA polymerase sigma-70 factor (ECF subfamily)